MKLNTMQMTPSELVEYIERLKSGASADYDVVAANTKSLLANANLTPRQKIDVQWSLVYLSSQYQNLIMNMDNHIKGLQEIAGKSL